MIRRAALLLLSGLLVLAPLPAAADAVFVGASPANNSTVGGTVRSVQIVFNEIVSQATVTIDGPDGPVRLSELVDSGQVISASFPGLSVEGRYIVRYAVTSADTDPVDGVFAFMFREGAPGPLPVVAPALAEDGGPDRLVVAMIGAAVVLVVIGGLQAVVRTRRLRQLTSSKRVPSDG